MTEREEILSKEVLRGSDIMKLCSVKQTTASHIIGSIKRVSDILGIRGIVHIRDYNAWLEARTQAERQRKGGTI